MSDRRQEFRTTISRVMARVPVGLSKDTLAVRIAEETPKDFQPGEKDLWYEEFNLALKEWNADLPQMASGAPVACPGGNLVTSPISTARPIPVPSESREQTSFL